MSGLKGALGSVMDVFRTTPAATAAAATGAPPDQQNKTVPNPADPTAQRSDGTVAAIPATAEGEASPLAGYEKLWETSDKDPKRATLSPTLSFDPKKMVEEVGKINFTQNIKPELLKAALAGDENALAAAMNQAVQTSVAVMSGNFTSTMQRILNDQNKLFHEQVMPQVLRDHAASSAISEGNPIFDNPAVKPMLDDAKRQLTLKYPDATPAEIAKHARIYVAGMATEIIKSQGGTVDIPKVQETGTPAAKKTAIGDMDWTAWATSPTS